PHADDLRLTRTPRGAMLRDAHALLQAARRTSTSSGTRASSATYGASVRVRVVLPSTRAGPRPATRSTNAAGSAFAAWCTAAASWATVAAAPAGSGRKFASAV